MLRIRRGGETFGSEWACAAEPGGRRLGRARHRPARPGEPGRLPAATGRRTPPWSPTRPTALPWQLRSAGGAVVAQRADHAARRRPGLRAERAHHRLRLLRPTPAAGYTLTADGETSHPFDISGDVYDELRSDALKFFYTQRSGIAIDGRLRRRAVRPPGRPRRRRPEHRATPTCRASRACATTARRPRRLVRRRRPRQVRRQRRHLGLPAAQHLRARLARSGRSAEPLADGTLRMPESGNASRTSSTRRAGSWIPAEHAGAGRAAARRHGAPQDPRQTGPACRCSRRTTRSRASCTRRRPPPR